MKIKVGVSVRHVHLTKEVYKKLFGEEELKIETTLDQPTQFASNQVVTIKNGNREITNVRIVGPLRDYNQVEVSKTDCFILKVNPPIRTSGDLKGSSPITIVGPLGEVTLDQGLILANRHIHITEEELETYGLKENDKLKIKAIGEKGGILDNVYLKVQEGANFILHLDTDDANAFNIKNEDEVEAGK